MSASLNPRVNVWVERDGSVVVSRWRVRLLEAIAETGSISGAAARLGVQYRLAWDRLHEMEEGLGVVLVERRVGGPGGGGGRLTEAGADLIARFNRLAAEMDATLDERFEEIFGSEP